MKKFEHRGLSAEVNYSEDDGLFVGKVRDIDSLLLFCGASVDALYEDFVTVVDEYYAHCKAFGIEPSKPCKGSFNVRVGSVVHRQAVTIAKAQGSSLNDFVRLAIEEKIAKHLSHDLAAATVIVRMHSTERTSHLSWDAKQEPQGEVRLNKPVVAQVH